MRHIPFGFMNKSTSSENLNPISLEVNYQYRNGGFDSKTVDFYISGTLEYIGTYTFTGQTGTTTLSINVPNSYVGTNSIGLELRYCYGVTTNADVTTAWSMYLNNVFETSTTNPVVSDIPLCPTKDSQSFGVSLVGNLNYNDVVIFNVLDSYSQTNTPSLTDYLDAKQSTSYPGTGTTWYDLSLNDNDFTLYNTPTFVSGSTPYYFSFDGVSEYSESNVSGTTTVSNNCTWGGWVKTDQSATDKTFYVNGKNENIGGSNFYYNLRLWKNSSNKFVATIRKPVLPVDFNATGTTTMVTDQWYYIIATYDRTNSELKLYVNGQLETTTNTGPGTGNLYNNARGWQIATINNTYSEVDVSTFELYTGLYGYSTVLSATNILNNFNAQKSNYGY